MLNSADLAALQSSIGKQKLVRFAEFGWPILEGARPLARNWHQDAICDHLQAVTRREIRRIIINIPPRNTKSLLCNVIWPVWDWLHVPSRSFIFASYRAGLSERDNRKAHKLMSSPWFQSRFEPRIDPMNSRNDRFGIIDGGERMIASVAGQSSTGEGADTIVIDDPISADDARSEPRRRECIYWFDETIKSRFNDPKQGAFVVVMQRLHEDDLTGHILAHETGWDHLCLPARYDPTHPHPVRSSIGFRDPRTEDGELLHPDRFGHDELEAVAKQGSYADAGQLQQRPAPRGGGLFSRDDFNIVERIPDDYVWVRAWDLAATKKRSATEKKASNDPAWTAGVLVGMSTRRPRRFCIANVKRIQGSPAEVENLIRRTAKADAAVFPDRVRGDLPQDPGQAGKFQSAYLIGELAGFAYSASPESGSKETRADPVASQVEAGNVDIVRSAWNKPFLDEVALFPRSKFSDQVDAMSRGFAALLNGNSFEWAIATD